MEEKEIGLLPTKFDVRDYSYDVMRDKLAMATPVPEEYMALDKFPVKNQGPDGACVAFACSVMKDYQEEKDMNIEEPTAAGFIYNNRKNIPDSGMYFKDAFKILKDKGVCLETTFPWVPRKVKKITKKALKEAAKHKIANYARIDSVEAIKEAIFKYGPVVMGSGVFGFGVDFWDSKNGNPFYGRHATALIGWNKQGFIGQNSWGGRWGEEGTFFIPFDKINTRGGENWPRVLDRSGQAGR
jgi:C1A family cysteine protease